MDDEINHIHERVLHIVYQGYANWFEDILEKECSLTFHQRNIHKIPIEMFVVKYDLFPLFMKLIFIRNEKTQGTRSEDTSVRPK